jgi:hypothetical protein
VEASVMTQPTGTKNPDDYYFDRSISWLTERINSGDVFSYSRYNDGEWLAIGGAEGQNCDQHAYFKGLGRDLRKALTRKRNAIASREERYIFQSHKKWRNTENLRHIIDDFVSENDVGVRFLGSNPVLHNLVKHREAFLAFVEAINKHPQVIVGPPHLKPICSGLLNCTTFIEIPEQNCYLARRKIRRQVTRAVTALGTGPVFISFSASMTTNVLIDDLFDRLGNQHWLFDAGSIWNLFVGDTSRRWMSDDLRLQYIDVMKSIGTA